VSQPKGSNLSPTPCASSQDGPPGLPQAGQRSRLREIYPARRMVAGCMMMTCAFPALGTIRFQFHPLPIFRQRCRPTGRPSLSDRLFSLCCHWLAGGKGWATACTELSRETAIKRVAFQTKMDDVSVPKLLKQLCICCRLLTFEAEVVITVGTRRVPLEDQREVLALPLKAVA
jgi:hypothetical protein